jgi:hypothetical protein
VAYSEYYEPYVIMSAERYVPYDERFRGYGMNKCIHLKALHSLGFSFHVIPSHFLVAGSHERSQAHTQTYGPDSGFRKFVVAAIYDRARDELRASGQPLVAAQTEAMLKRMRSIWASKELSIPVVRAPSCLPSMGLIKGKLSELLTTGTISATTNVVG